MNEGVEYRIEECLPIGRRRDDNIASVLLLDLLDLGTHFLIHYRKQDRPAIDNLCTEFLCISAACKNNGPGKVARTISQFLSEVALVSHNRGHESRTAQRVSDGNARE